MRILAARMDSEGDVLLSGPALRALAAGGNEVTLLCGPRGRSAAGLLPGVDRVITEVAEWIDAEPPPVDAARTARLIDSIASVEADKAVIFTSFHQSPLPMALLMRLAGVPWVGAISIDYPGSLLDLRHADPGDVHEVERALGLAAAAGHHLPADDEGRLTVKVAADVRHERLPSDRLRVAVHPGASVPARAWAPERHRDLVRLLSREGCEVMVTGGPAERELTAFVAGGSVPGGMVSDLGGETAMGELAGLLAACDAVVVGNTGPAHLAAAVGTPVVSLFALTVPEARWRPWGVPTVVLSHPVPCAGCRARECPVPGHPCVDEVTPEAALEATLSLIGAKKGEGVA